MVDKLRQQDGRLLEEAGGTAVDRLLIAEFSRQTGMETDYRLGHIAQKLSDELGCGRQVLQWSNLKEWLKHRLEYLYIRGRLTDTPRSDWGPSVQRFVDYELRKLRANYAARRKRKAKLHK